MPELTYGPWSTAARCAAAPLVLVANLTLDDVWQCLLKALF